MHFPTLRVCQAEDHRFLVRISPLENEAELLARRQTLDLVEKCETQGTGALLDKQCDAFKSSELTMPENGKNVPWMSISAL